MESTQRWHELKALFVEAVDVPPADRPAWLIARCGDRGHLRAELESLLAQHARHHTVLDEPLAAIPPPDETLSDLLAPGHLVGAFRINRLVGRGGMGVVYAATRADGTFEKDVAIKVVGHGVSSPEVLRRFRSERQVLANLEHANIATLLDGGTTAAGQPYLVMEFVAGQPIDAFCDAHALSIDDRVRLFLRVCGAVQHAHERLVVHRDLKPDNILVGADSEPKLLDFGIAKLLEPDVERGPLTTGFRPMTPTYASPEQIRGEPVGTATDIYSLGVILFQLLTGRLPHGPKSQVELAQAICELPPMRPSDAATGSRATRAWRRKLRGDLDAMVLMALRKEPERRYRSVQHFSDDLRRHLDGMPVTARPDTIRYRTGAFVRRNRMASTAAGLAAVALVAGIIGTSWSALIARREAASAAAQREAARAEAARAQKVSAFITTMLALPDPSWNSPGSGGTAAMTVMDLLKQTGDRIDKELADHPDVAADLHHTLGNTYIKRGRYSDAEGHFTSALQLRRRAFGNEHAKVAESLYFLGAAEVSQGRWQHGEGHYREAVALERRLPQPDRNFPYVLRDLGGLRRQRGDLVEAEQLLTEAAVLLDRQYGPNQLPATFARDNLAAMRADRGDYAGAERMYREILQVRRQVGAPPTVIAEVLRDIARAVAQRDPSAAEPLVREALAIYVTTLGADNPVTADTQQHLAAVLFQQRRFAEAEALAGQSLATFRSLSNPMHWSGADALFTLGMIASATRRPQEAEQHLREALSVADRGSGSNECQAGRIRLTLGRWLRDRGRRAESAPLLTQAVQEIGASCGRESATYRDAVQSVGPIR